LRRLSALRADFVSIVKYSPAGEPVGVHVAGRNGAAVIVVADRGLGIAADDQRLIFEKFVRVRRTGSGSKPGTGLGLYLHRALDRRGAEPLPAYAFVRAGRSSAASARARTATWVRSSGGSSTIASPR
jgi:hypothetical protein